MNESKVNNDEKEMRMRKQNQNQKRNQNQNRKNSFDLNRKIVLSRRFFSFVERKESKIHRRENRIKSFRLSFQQNESFTLIHHEQNRQVLQQKLLFEI